MRDVHHVLREKEVVLKQVRREIEALRLVCNLLYDEGDFTPNILESGLEREEESDVFRLVEEREDALARIRERPVDTPPRNIKKGSGRSVLLQFRQVALDASRMFLRRVLDSSLLGHDPQRKSIRDLYERLGRFGAA